MSTTSTFDFTINGEPGYERALVQLQDYCTVHGMILVAYEDPVVRNNQTIIKATVAKQ